MQTHCNALHYRGLQDTIPQYLALHCDATRCNKQQHMLQHTVTHCTAVVCTTPFHGILQCTALQHDATYGNTLHCRGLQGTIPRYVAVRVVCDVLDAFVDIDKSDKGAE